MADSKRNFANQQDRRLLSGPFSLGGIELASTKQLLQKSTLENPLLYRNFLRALQKNNPNDYDRIDHEVIDRSLEYEEAFKVLQAVYPWARISKESRSELDDYREFLCDSFSICDPKIQNYIIQDLKQPFTEEELGEIGYTLNERPAANLARDQKRRAPVTRDIRRYIKKPNRLDLPGVDTKK